MEFKQEQKAFMKRALNKSKVLKCVIVDNDTVLSEKAIHQIEDAGGRIVSVCSNSMELEDSLDLYKVDIVFINTNLGKDKEVAKLINSMIGSIPKIPYTNEDDNLYSFANPTSILKFPSTKLNIVNAIKIAMSERAIENSYDHGTTDMNKPLFFRVDGKMISIKPCSIKYMESIGNYIYIYTTNDKLSIRSSIKKMIDLLDSPYFLQVQRAYIVNINFISELVINSNLLKVEDVTIPIGRRFKKATLDRLRQQRN